jgi:hypothetical protein
MKPNDPYAAEPLADALKRLAADLEAREPPLAVQRAVVARWKPASQLALAGGASRRATWAPWPTAALVGTLLVLSTALFLQVPADPRDGAVTEIDAGFVPVASAERWPGAGAQASPAWLVRAELPRERLAEFGLPFDPARAGDTVRTELLMRASGEVLAVRVLAETAPR